MCNIKFDRIWIYSVEDKESDWECTNCRRNIIHADVFTHDGNALLVCNHCLDIVEYGRCQDECWEDLNPYLESDE